MDRFAAMQAFARVVEAGSFTKAAQTLGLSKTTVTQLIQQLEARLQVKLLHRTTRQVRVTADGAAYHERVQRLLADLADADASLARATSSPRGTLRIELPGPIATHLVMPALPDFHARYPEIRLECGVSDRLTDLIGENVDCALRAGDLADSTLIARRVGDLRFAAYASPGYLARCGTPRDPRELADSPHRSIGFLGARSRTPLPIRLQRGAEAVELSLRHAVAVDDGHAYLAAGQAGLGLLWLPEYLAAPCVARGQLIPLFDGWQMPPMPLYLLTPPNRHPSTRLRVFTRWLEGLIARHAPVMPGR